MLGRILGVLATVVGLAVVGVWAWREFPAMRQSVDSVKGLVNQSVGTGNFATLESVFTPDQIMTSHKAQLLKTPQHEFADVHTEFQPYVLMDVKYTLAGSTQEGQALWSLVEGEMVTDASTWALTHGFEDAITAGSSEEDFKVLNAVAEVSGGIDHQDLINKLPTQPEKAEEWVNKTLEKQLIVLTGKQYRLHFQNPKIRVTPATKISVPLVAQANKGAVRTPSLFTPKQVEFAAKAAFGKSFAIRSSQEVFLPVYSIKVKNPDGSILTTYWNALNGRQMERGMF